MKIYNTALQGLNTARAALDTTSQNITNANTEGYNRRITDIESTEFDSVRVNGVRRQSNFFIDTQRWTSISSREAFQSQVNQIGPLESLLSDVDQNIGSALSEYFDSAARLMQKPNDPAARQTYLGAANVVTSQFRGIQQQFNANRTLINKEIETTVNTINDLSASVAQLNKEITFAQGQGNESPNTLLDKRDQAITELSALVGVDVIRQKNGVYNVSMKGGTALVSGQTARLLNTQPDGTDASNTIVTSVTPDGGEIPIRSENVRGGALGGLLEYRRESFDDVENKINRLALVFADQVNQLQESGIDANGDPGAPLFSFGDPLAFRDPRNDGTATFTIEIDDSTQLRPTSFDVIVTDAAAGELQLKDSAGKTQTVTLDGAGSATVEGFTVTVDDIAQLQDGDTFLFKPVSNAINSLDVLIEAPVQVVAGTTSAPGDNEVALQILRLKDANVMQGGSTFSADYAGTIGELGSRSLTAQIQLDIQTNLSTFAEDLKQTDSGVNLDEEAVNLVKFQQYYEANARVIDAASNLFDTLLSLRG